MRRLFWLWILLAALGGVFAAAWLLRGGPGEAVSWIYSGIVLFFDALFGKR